MKNLVLDLTVQNHPGVMSHIAGLFSRRGFNMEGIICYKIGNGQLSKIYLLVEENHQLDQILKQLEKLYDVNEISINRDFDFEKKLQ